MVSNIEPARFIRKTNIDEHNEMINKINELVTFVNDAEIEQIPQIQSDVETLKSQYNTVDTEVSENTQNIDGLLKEVVNEVTVDAPGYGQVRVSIVHEDESVDQSNVLQIPVIQDGSITIISGTTDRSFKLQYSTMDGVTHTTNDFVIPVGGGTDVSITSITILQGDTADSFKFSVGLSDGSTIESNSYSISADLTDYVTKTELANDLADYMTSEDVAASYQPKGDYLTSVPIGGTAIGGVKNGGNVIIESDGTMNAPGGEWEIYTGELSELMVDYIATKDILLEGNLSGTVPVTKYEITSSGVTKTESTYGYNAVGSVQIGIKGCRMSSTNYWFVPFKGNLTLIVNPTTNTTTVDLNVFDLSTSTISAKLYKATAQSIVSTRVTELGNLNADEYRVWIKS